MRGQDKMNESLSETRLLVIPESYLRFVQKERIVHQRHNTIRESK